MNQEGGEPVVHGPMPVPGYVYGNNGRPKNCSELSEDEYQESTEQHGCRTKGIVFKNSINSDFKKYRTGTSMKFDKIFKNVTCFDNLTESSNLVG